MSSGGGSAFGGRLEVHVPQMPETKNPRLENWILALAQAVGTADEHTYFVGHSMGCKTIACYLETLPDGLKVGGAVFVGGFFKRLINTEDQNLAGTLIAFPVDLHNVRSHLPRSVAIFSDNDLWVPLDNQDDFRDKLGSEIVIEHGKGHFTGGDDEIYELPIVLEKLSAMMQ